MPLGPGFGRNSANGGGGGGGAVSSVFSRSGDVEADSADYAAYYGQLSVNNTWSGVNTHNGSFIFAPATVTVAANAGAIDITKVHSSVAISANVALTPSGAGTLGQQICVIVVNSDSSARTVTGAGTASTISFTAAALSTTTTYWRSSGSAWTVIGGAVTINDISSVTPVLADSVSFWDASGGVSGKTTFTTLQGIMVAARLGSHTTPDTTGGAISWTAPVYEVFTNTTTPYVLPAAAGYDGKAVIFYVTGTNAIAIDPNGSEVIVRSGTVQTGGVTITLAGVAGNYVALICDGVRWVTLGYIGTLALGS
jgi:hypothetical protein